MGLTTNRPVTRSDPKNQKMARFGPQVAPYGQIVVYNGTWGQHLLPQQVPAQTEPRRPQHHPIPCFQPPCFVKFGNFSQPGQKFSKSGPKIGPRPFSKQFRAAKRAAECRCQQIKRSYDGPILAFQLRGNFSHFDKVCAFGAKGRPPAGHFFEKYMHLFGKWLFLTSFVPSALRAGLRRVNFLKSTGTLWKKDCF